MKTLMSKIFVQVLLGIYLISSLVHCEISVKWMVKTCEAGSATSPCFNTHLDGSTTYRLQFELQDIETGLIDSDAAEALRYMGISPFVIAQRVEDRGLFDHESLSYDSDTKAWSMALTTGSTSVLPFSIISSLRTGTTSTVDYDAATGIPAGQMYWHVEESTDYVQYLRVLDPLPDILLTNASDSTNALSINQMELFSMPRRSPAAVLILNEQSYRVAFSTDQFESFNILDFNTSTFNTASASSLAAHPAIVNCANQGITVAIVTISRAVVAAPAGLMQYILSSSTDITSTDAQWEMMIPACVTDLYTSSHYLTHVDQTSDLLIAVTCDPVMIHVSDNAQSGFVELTDSSGLSIIQYYNETDAWGSDYQILGVAHSIIFPDNLLILVDKGASTCSSSCTGRYTMYTNEAKSTWTRQAELPALIPAPSDTDHDPIPLYPSTIQSQYSTASLLLYSLHYSSAPALDLYAFGNALLFSANGGISFTMIHYFADTTVEVLRTSTNGAYAMLTKSGELWFGRGIHSKCTQIYSARTSVSTFRTLFFGSSHTLYELSAVNGTAISSTSITRSTELIEMVVSDALVRTARVKRRYCPYDSIFTVATTDSLITRYTPNVTHQVLTEKPSSKLPETIYLNYGSSYSFLVYVIPSEFAGDTEVEVGFQLSGQGADQFQISFSQVPYQQNRYYPYEEASARLDSVTYPRVYEVSITDLLGVREQEEPGTGLLATSLRIQVKNTTWACDDNNQEYASFLESTAPIVTSIVSGCPPLWALRYDAESSQYSGESCDIQSGEDACLSYQWEFTPVLWLEDQVAGTSSQYTEDYTFSIIGGGSTIESIESYSETEIDDFNQGGKSIWSVLNSENDDINILSQGYSISWVCGNGSPCNSVIPTLPDTPEYFFKVEISSKNAFQETYCDFRTTFVIRLHGLQMASTDGLIVAALVVAFIALCTICGYYFCCYKVYTDSYNCIQAVVNMRDRGDMHGLSGSRFSDRKSRPDTDYETSDDEHDDDDGDEDEDEISGDSTQVDETSYPDTSYQQTSYNSQDESSNNR